MTSVPTPSRVPSLFEPSVPEPEPPVLEAPEHLVRTYVELVAERRRLEDRLAYIRGELEMLAASALSEATPRGRFLAGDGHISARLQPTCVFDKGAVARELQKAGRLADVAVLQGPALARFLAKEPVLAARLSDLVRMRRSVVLMAQG